MTSAVDVVLQSGAKAAIGHLKGKCIYPMNYFVLIIFFTFRYIYYSLRHFLTQIILLNRLLKDYDRF
jgi:hypothetical protein